MGITVSSSNNGSMERIWIHEVQDTLTFSKEVVVVGSCWTGFILDIRENGVILFEFTVNFSVPQTVRCNQ